MRVVALGIRAGQFVGRPAIGTLRRRRDPRFSRPSNAAGGLGRGWRIEPGRARRSRFASARLSFQGQVHPGREHGILAARNIPASKRSPRTEGPTFSQPVDLTIDGLSGLVKVGYTDAGGQETALNERLTLPSDVANGLLFTLLQNVPRARLPRSLWLPRHPSRAW